MNPGEQEPGLALAPGAQGGGEGTEGVRLDESAVGDHQGAGNAQAGEVGRQFGEGADAIKGAGGEGECGEAHDRAGRD